MINSIKQSIFNNNLLNYINAQLLIIYSFFHAIYKLKLILKETINFIIIIVI